MVVAMFAQYYNTSAVLDNASLGCGYICVNKINILLDERTEGGHKELYLCQKGKKSYEVHSKFGAFVVIFEAFCWKNFPVYIYLSS